MQIDTSVARSISLRNFVFVFLRRFFSGPWPVPKAAETRIALVVGSANYSSGDPLAPANDAGLIAQTLRSVGFNMIGVLDLDRDLLRRPFWGLLIMLIAVFRQGVPTPVHPKLLVPLRSGRQGQCPASSPLTWINMI